jgi:hypothetical protein
LVLSKPIIEFRLDLDSHGWAEICLLDGEQELRTGASYINDGLGDFIRAVTFVCTEQVTGAICEWAHEPGRVSVEIRHGPFDYPNLDLVIWYYSERRGELYTPTDSNIQFRATYNGYDLANATSEIFGKLLELLGPKNTNGAGASHFQKQTLTH